HGGEGAGAAGDRGAHPLPSRGPVHGQGAQLMTATDATWRADGRRLGQQLAPIIIVCAIVFVVPVFLDSDFLLNKLARYLVLGWFIFRGRVTGVYVAIITLAAMVVINLVIIDQQSYTGGFNGITDLAQLELFGVTFDAYGRSTYYLVAACLTVSLLLAFAFT